MKSRTTIAFATLLLLLPAASAAWSTYGSYEPSTPLDIPSLMWQDAPVTPGKRVYFNAFTSTLEGTATGYSVNPNVAALHTRNEAPASEYHIAVLGVWTDCNQDGYVGMAEGAVREYKSELLLDASLCPPATGSPQKFFGDHNYNGLVTEIIPIHRYDSVRDARRFVDLGARVWGDFERPDDRPHGSCTLSPQPRGTYQSTGGALNFVDCRADVLGGFNTAMDAAGDPAGLRFADENDARSGTLGQVSTFGSEDSQYSPVNAWDCSGGEDAYAFRSGDALNDTLGEDQASTFNRSVHDVVVYNPSTNPVGNTAEPTAPGFLNATNEGLDNCDTSDDRGNDFYSGACVLYCVGESDFNGVDPNNKREADWNFRPANVSRGGAPASLVGPGAAGMDEYDLGLMRVSPGGILWYSDSVWLSKPGPSVVRTNVDTGTADVAAAYWLTFYASLSSASTDQGLQLPGGSGTYGASQCGANEDGIHNGWNCDATQWYLNPDGSYVPDDEGVLVKIGQTYNLRDVDCYDGSNDLGVGVMPAFYGSEPCP